MAFVWTAAGVLFLFGLIQWARSGAVLWDIRSMSKPDAAAEEGAETESLRKKENIYKKTIQRMERTMDELLKSSLRVLGTLAIFVWLFVLVTIVVDLLGLDWLDRMSFTANRILGNPSARSSYNRTGGASSSRNNALRNMGSGVRR